MLFSIIMPVYNAEKTLTRGIDSVLKQTLRDFEIIIVDDGSTDGSAHIIDSYASDSRVKVFHQKNSGVSTSRNRALHASKGEYFSIVDQDDVLAPDYISYLYDLCIRNKTSIALTPNVDKFFRKIKTDKRGSNVRVITGREAVITMLYHKYVIAPWNKLIKKEIVDCEDIEFNPNFFNGEGFAFSIECLQAASRVAVGNKKIYHYRVGDPSSGASTYKEKYIRSSIEAQQYIKNALEYKDRDILQAWTFSNWHTHCDAFNLMVGCDAKNKNIGLYRYLENECRKDAAQALTAPVSGQQRLRGLLFMINPTMAAKIINLFRDRKFSK